MLPTSAEHVTADIFHRLLYPFANPSFALHDEACIMVKLSNEVMSYVRIQRNLRAIQPSV